MMSVKIVLLFSVFSVYRFFVVMLGTGIVPIPVPVHGIQSRYPDLVQKYQSILNEFFVRFLELHIICLYLFFCFCTEQHFIIILCLNIKLKRVAIKSNHLFLRIDIECISRSEPSFKDCFILIT